jgi:hypothetical protein
MPRDIRVPVAVLSGLILVGLSVGAAEPVALVINVIDYASTPAGLLIEAQHHVARLYGVAGVKVVWREKAPGTTATDVGQLSVIILSNSMAEHKAASETISPAVLGSAAPPPSRRVWIFLTRIEDVSARQGLSPGLVLGHVIAHEVAHTIANVEHSSAGVMNASLRVTSDTLQGFTEKESQQLRAALQATHHGLPLDARNRSQGFRPSSDR